MQWQSGFSFLELLLTLMIITGTAAGLYRHIAYIAHENAAINHTLSQYWEQAERDEP